MGRAEIIPARLNNQCYSLSLNQHAKLASETMSSTSSGAYEKVKAGRLAFKDGTLATRAKSINKKKKKKKSKPITDGIESDDVINNENEAQIHQEGTEGGSGEVIYTIDAAKKLKYEELFPVEAKKFSYDPKAKVKSVEQALDDRVKKKADRYGFSKWHKGGPEDF